MKKSYLRDVISQSKYSCETLKVMSFYDIAKLMVCIVIYVIHMHAQKYTHTHIGEDVALIFFQVTTNINSVYRLMS